MRALKVSSCRQVCTWSRTPDELDGLPLFACGGCGSEWVRTEPWTPIGADGIVPDDVLAELAERDGGTRG